MDPKAQLLIQVVLVIVVLVIGWYVFKPHWTDGQWWVQGIGVVLFLFFIAVAVAIGIWGDDIMRGETPPPIIKLKALKNH
jgi:protein-S-isoprenylcysteine O-methyltransferase Ste14